jgi:hypothetical protein
MNKQIIKTVIGEKQQQISIGLLACRMKTAALIRFITTQG